MYSGSVAATGTHSAGRAVAMTSAQSKSRPATSGARSWGRCRLMQRRGFTSASSIALSSSGLYGGTRVTAVPRAAGARAIEDPIPAFGPVDGLARFGPEPLRVPGPPRIHLGLGALRGVEGRRGAHESAVRESGAEGARTPDLLGAIQALSQLSYSPVGRRNLESPPPASNPLII